jgi:hypothetical protein
MSRSFLKFDQIISKNDTIRANNRITAQVGATLPLRGTIGAIVGELGQIGGNVGQIDQFFRGHGPEAIFKFFSVVVKKILDKVLI